jgi:ATP-dependent DNA helicase RecG
MLKALLSAMQEVVEAPSRHQVGTKSELNAEQLQVLSKFDGDMSITALMNILKRTDRSKFRSQILNPLMAAGLVEQTIPEKPTSSKQKYRLKRNPY